MEPDLEQQPTSHTEQQLRPEQEHIFGQIVVDEGNIVVVASTGFGKTRVAFAAVEAALCRHPRRVVVFLCPTVPLANQQRDYWDRCCGMGGERTSLVVAGSGGASFGRAHVTFATPAKFVAHLVADTQGLAALGLLVIDECHHAYRASGSSSTSSSRHPYTEVAEVYRTCVPHRRPKILGLTASPGATHTDVVELARVLQARFVSAGLGEVAATKCITAGSTSGVLLAERLRYLEGVAIQLQRELAEDDGNQVAQVIGLAALWRAVGCGELLRKACTDMPEAQPLLELDRQIEAGATVGHWLTPPARLLASPSDEPGGSYGPVLHTVVRQLMASLMGYGPGEFRAIVFTQTQLAARAASALLNCSSAEHGLKCGTLLGQGGAAGMTMARQREMLARFRAGDEINVLFATSIAEEGLDIQQCGLVIRTEPPRSIIQNIQGRGRARQLGATYAVVVLDEVRD